MASIYRRPPGSRDGIFWIAFYHPVSGDLIRRTLDTAERARAERICTHVEALCKAASPSAPVLPESIQEILLPEKPAVPFPDDTATESTTGGILSRQPGLLLLEAKPKMPSIYPRPADAENPVYWVALYHPTTGAQIRKSLETRNQEDAERKVQKIKALCDLIGSKDVVIPSAIVDAIGAREVPLITGGSNQSAPLSLAIMPAPKRCTVEEVVRSLLKTMLVGNDGHYFDNALSYSRRLFGSAFVERIDPRPVDLEKEKKRKKPDQRKAPFREPGINAYFLDEVTGEMITDFLIAQGFGIDSCRHYKEFVRRLINHAVESGLHIPANPFAPNAMKSLPSFVDTERDIVVLSPEDEFEQLNAVLGDWRVTAGIRILLGTGMRLHEMLSVRVADVFLDKCYLRLLKNNRRTKPFGAAGNPSPKKSSDSIAAPRALRKKQTLKRGERTVALMPELLDFLPGYLERLKTDGYEWLVPSPQGMRWSPSNFGKQLHQLNVTAELDFTAADMRSTYATRRISENWPLRVLARQMGTSVKMLELHYGGYIPPEALKYCVRDVSVNKAQVP